jgi:hypothetical protein
MPPLTDFPDSFSAHRASVFAHTGPASYTQMTTGPLAGGDTVEAVEAGMTFFDAVIPIGLSDSGVYRVEAVAPVGNPSTNKQAAHARTWLLRWVVVSTGAEAAALLDLDGETVRLFAVGRY